MAINFPNSPSNGQIFTSGGRSYEYNSTAGVWNRKEQTVATVPSDISDLTDTGGVLGTGGATVYADMTALIAATGMSNGDFGLVTANNNIYVYNGSGWYKIATVQNDSPSAITGVSGSYELAVDGTATTITAVSTDPEGFPLTWSYSTSGLGSIATVSNTDGVFTITPSTTEADAGTFTLTINATDGVNGAVSTSTSLTLNFIITVTNSNYTTLLASVASNSPYSLPSANNQVSSFSVNSQTSSPTEVVFGDSGTKMFVLSSDRYVYSYNLSTAYDASTASYVATSSELTQFSTNTSESFRFKPDGTVMFVSGSNGNVYQYSLTAWDVSTIAYASKSAQHASHTGSYKAITFKPDGTRIYISSLRYVMSMTLSSPWDLGSTTSDNTSAGFTNAYLNLGWVYGNTITGMDFNSTGTSLTMVYGNNSSDKYIIEHPIDDAWNVSNATVLGSAPTTTYQQNSIQGLAYANDGNTLVTVLDTGDTVYTYDTGMSGINNNITDASTNNHSITVNGDAHAGTFSPYRSGGYSTLFGSNTNYGRYELTNNISLTGDFTIEFWFSGTEYTGRNQILGSGFNIRKEGSGWYTSISWPQGSYSIPNNEVPGSEWHWVQLIRSSGSAQLYIDGNTVGAAVANTTTYNLNSGYASKLIIGYEATSERFDGYLRDLRISNVARTAAIPTAPLELDSNTHVLLFNKAAQIAETGLSNTLTLTALGDPEMYAVGPYDYNEYSATDHGGSVYFGGGTREHLSTSLPAFGTQDFEVEFWIYGGALTSNTWYTLFSRDYNVNGSFRIYCSGGSGELDEFIYIANGTQYNNTSAGKIKDNVWNHILLSRVSGTAKWFINGIADTSWSDSENMTSTATLYIGDTGADETSNSSYPFVGYMSDIAVRIGGSGYRTSSFTPPTAPLSSSGASLHIKGTDASIIDKSQSDNLKLESGTTGSTTQVKFSNTKSIYFGSPGVGLSTSAPVLDGAFTIEAWVYFNSFNANGWNTLFSQAQASGGPAEIAAQNNNNIINVSFNQSGTAYTVNATWNFSTSTWYHLAIVRDSNNTVAIYVDGTALSNVVYPTQTDTLFGHTADLYIGQYDIYNSYPFDGYMQDVRITKGLARYTANFTPPSAPLEG